MSKNPTYEELKQKVLALEQEVAKLKLAEDALRTSRQRLTLHLEQTPLGVIDWTLDFRVRQWNPAAEKIFGYSREEALGQYASFIIPKAVRVHCGEVWEALIAQRGGKRSTNENLTKSNRSILCEWYNTPLINRAGETIGVSSLVMDITERKRSEQALRESEEKYRTVLEANPDPIVVYDMKGRVIYLNPSFTNVFGWSLDERRGVKMDNFVPEENWAETKVMIDKVASGESFSGIETSRFTKDKKKLPVSISASYYRDVDGNIAASVINIRDVSRQKEIEARLQQAQKIESIGTLAGGIAHNFNNTLMGIQGRTSLMLMEKDPDDPDIEHLRCIEEYIRHATGLTKALLGFARGGKYEVKPTDLNALVHNESRMFGRTRKEIRVHGNYENALWIVEVDHGQVRQVLMNLYINAWQAMPEGGDLYVQTDNVNIEDGDVKSFEMLPGRYVKISVTDTGVGMDESVKDKIFDPFFTTQEMGQGTGLGLASVYGIIKNHGGLLKVDSKKGKGTTFKIYLPASASEVTTETLETERRIVRHRHGTVLLVDDEEMIISVGQKMLENLGYTVLVAKNGQEAIDVYNSRKDRIDLVILDLIMPGMNGGETFDRLKKIDFHVKVLLSSGYSINGQAKEILDRGCKGFIQKPYNLTRLSEKMTKMLDKQDQ